MPYIEKEKKWLAHELASRIPWEIWQEEFGSRIDDEDLARMKLPLYIAAKRKSKEDRSSAFFCCLVGDHNADPNALVMLGRAWGIEDTRIAHYAAILGRIDVYDALWKSQYSLQTGELCAKEQQTLLEGDYEGYQFLHTRAARHGQLEFIRYLETLMTPKQILKALTGGYFTAYYHAAAKGHFDIVVHFETFLAEHKPNVIKQVARGAFASTIKNGHVPIVQHLAQKFTQDEIVAMVSEYKYLRYRATAQNNNVDMLHYLDTILPEDEKRKAIEADNFALIRGLSTEHRDMHVHFMAQPFVLAWITTLNIYEYVTLSEICSDFIQSRLSTWRSNAATLDMSETDCLSAYYMIKHLIKTNIATLSDDLSFLLSIPGVAALAHQEMNALLQLAMERKNQTAINLLLALPAVRELAEAEQSTPCDETSSSSSTSDTSDSEESGESYSTSENSESSESSEGDEHSSSSSSSSSSDSSEESGPEPAKPSEQEQLAQALACYAIGPGLFGRGNAKVSISISSGVHATRFN